MRNVCKKPHFEDLCYHTIFCIDSTYYANKINVYIEYILKKMINLVNISWHLRFRLVDYSLYYHQQQFCRSAVASNILDSKLSAAVSDKMKLNTVICVTIYTVLA